MVTTHYNTLRNALCNKLHQRLRLSNDWTILSQKLVPLFWSDFTPHRAYFQGAVVVVGRNEIRTKLYLSPHTKTNFAPSPTFASLFAALRPFALFSHSRSRSYEDAPSALESSHPTLMALSGDDGDLEDIETEKISLTFRKKFLRSNGIPYDKGFTCLKMPCILGCCTNGDDNPSQKMSTFMKKISTSHNRDLIINDTTGFFMCLQCQRQGTWRVLEDVISMLASSGKSLTSSMTAANALPGIKFSRPSLQHLAEVEFLYDNATLVADLSTIEFSKIVHRINKPSLTHSTFKKFGVKFDRGRNALLFPLTNRNGDVNGLKIVHLRIDDKNGNVNDSKEKIRDSEIFSEDVIPRTLNVPIGLFGLSSVPQDVTEIVLCAHVFDVMLLHQSKPALVALALPKGHCRLPQYELPQLETFKRITIWFDNDVHSWQQAKLFAQKLNNKRCSFIRPKEDQPSPSKAVAKGLSLKNILKSSEPIKHEAITTFSHLRQEVFEELRQIDQVKGLKLKRFPKLTKILQGHRRGELTVLTGPTGCGKTTFVSEYALDLAIQGTSTLWGSFEISNVRLLKTTLTQFAGLNLSKSLDRFDEFADAFEQLPLSFLRFHGPVPLKKVIDVMSHACYVHDITHVIVDNLQFMMYHNYSTGTNFDRFQLQDSIVSAFRQFATSKNCHVTLIVHPRKEDDPAAGLGISSIFGSAKATQEADNVVIMQSNVNKKYLQVVKNRFSGDLGVVPLSFDKETLSFYHKTPT